MKDKFISHKIYKDSKNNKHYIIRNNKRYYIKNYKGQSIGFKRNKNIR